MLAKEMGHRGCGKRKTAIFYKMIEESIIKDRKLMIPEMLVKKYGNELSATAILRVINGAVWQVGLNKLQNKLWFCHGWSEFIYHHSLHAGSFLVFAYHRDSTFDVYICDLRAREINNPPYHSCPKVSQHGNQNLITPANVEDDERSSSQSPAALETLAAGSGISDPQLLDKLDFGISKTDKSEDPLEDRVNPSCAIPLERGNIGVTVESDVKGLKRSRTEVSYSQGSNSSKIRAVKSQVIRNLEMFYGSQQVASVHGKKEKLSQSKFTSISRSAILGSAQGDATQYGSGEATKSNVTIIEVKKSMGGIRLYGLIQDAEVSENGQQEAVKPPHQHIREENICDKERTSRSVSRGPRVATTREKERALLAAKMYVPAFPYFRIALQPSYVSKGTLRLSDEFASTFLNIGASEFISLEISSGKRWRTRCIRRDGYAKLSSGWSEFVRANQLMEGDVCVFEVIKNGVLKVSIFRALEDVEQSNIGSHLS